MSGMARAGVCGGGGGLAVRWGGAWRGGGRRGRLKSPLRVEGVAGGVAVLMLAVQTFMLTCVTLMLTVATFMLGRALFLLTALTFQLTALTFMLGRQLKG